MGTSGLRQFCRLERLLVGLMALLVVGAIARSAVGSLPGGGGRDGRVPVVAIVGIAAVSGGDLAPASGASPRDGDAPAPRDPAVERAYAYLRATQDRYRLDGPRLLESYDAGDAVATAWVYDNSLAGLAFLMSNRPEDVARARAIADFLVLAARSDSAGRTHDVYDAREPTPRAIHVETSSGNVAWEALFLLATARSTGDHSYAAAAGEQLDWVAANLRDEREPGGYLGGVDAAGSRLMWRATEHNIDLWAAFDQAARERGDSESAERARHAERFVRAMWDPAVGHFLTGAGADSAVNRSPIPLDAQAWGFLVGGRKFASGLAWASRNLATSCLGRPCLRFSSQGQGGWYEGTAQMALARRLAGEAVGADELLASIATAILPSGAIPAATAESCDTGYGWSYPAAPVGHVGATAWFSLASADVTGVYRNPFALLAPLAVNPAEQAPN